MSATKKKLSQLFQYLLFLSVGVGILWSMYQNQSAKYLEECMARGEDLTDCSLLDKILTDFASVDLFWMSIVLVLYMVSNIVRAIRWQMLLKPLGHDVGFGNAFMATMIGYFVNLGLPRSGEFVKSAFLAKYENIEVEKVFGTIVTDRLMDVICLLVVIALAFLTEFDILWNLVAERSIIGQKLEQLASHPLLIILIVLGLLLSGTVAYRFMRKSENRIIQTIRNKIAGLWEGIISIGRLERPFLFIFYSLLIWLCYYLMTYLCFFAFTPTAHLSAGDGLLTFVFGTLGMVFPSPGGMGSYHYLIGEALGILGISSTDAFSFANIIFFSIQIFCNVLLGIASLLIIPLYNAKRKMAH